MQSIEDEVWVTIIDLPEYYQVSSLGRIRSLPHTRAGEIIQDKISCARYLRLTSSYTLCNTNCRRDELVWESFNSKLKLCEYVNHKDGNTQNCALNNLEVVDTSAVGTCWKDIPEFDGIYQVSVEGKVKRIRHFSPHATCNKLYQRAMILKEQEDEDGYIRVSITNPKTKYSREWGVHQLVAKTFLPNPNNLPVVNHIDGNKKNNHKDNLEWCTVEYNNYHAKLIGLRPHSIYENREAVKAKLSKPVRCIETGQEFRSCIEAERQLGLYASAVSLAARNRKPTKGLTFEYI